MDRVLWSSRSVAHIARHEITPEEVEDVLFSPPLDARHGKQEGTYLVFGRSRADAGSWSSSHRAHVTAGTSLPPATSTEPNGGG